jgi:tetratricopeptide (TPR) repeat protein
MGTALHHAGSLDAAKPLVDALRDYRQARALRPAEARYRLSEAKVLNLLGIVRERQRGGSGAADHEAALALVEEWLRDHPPDPETLFLRGAAHAGLAEARGASGGDAEPSAGLALRDFSAALAGGHKLARIRRGQLSLLLVRLQPDGADAAGRIESAFEDFAEALRRDPGDRSARLGRGDASRERAILREARGESGDADFEAAIEDATAALQRGPTVEALLARAETLREWGSRRCLRGLADAALLRRAVDDATAAIDLRPREAMAWRERANSRVWLTIALQGDAGEWRRALEDISEAVRLAPENGVLYRERARIRGDAVSRTATRREELAQEYEESLSDYAEALRINPRDCDALLSRGLAHYNAAMRAPVAQRPDILKLAIDDLGGAARITPAAASAWGGLALAHAKLATLETGGAAESRFEQALAAASRAVEIEEGRATFWLWRGSVRYEWAMHRAAAGRAAGALYEEAAADADRAAALRPGDLEIVLLRGQARFRLAEQRVRQGGRHDDLVRSALADLEGAAAASPYHARSLKSMIDWCQGVLGK